MVRQKRGCVSALTICIFYFTAFVVVTIHVLWSESREFHRWNDSNNIHRVVEAFVMGPSKRIATTTTTNISRTNHRRHFNRRMNEFQTNQEGYAKASSSSSEDISEDRLLLERLHAKLYKKSRNNYYNIQGNENDVDSSSSSSSPKSLLVGNPNKRLSAAATAGLSKFHQSIVSSVPKDRQRCVTGEYPLKLSFANNPTHKWLSNSFFSSYCQMLVNGTSIDKSLASYDRFQWLDVQERNAKHDKYALLSLEFIAEINVRKPGYVNLLPKHGPGLSASLNTLNTLHHNNVPSFFQNRSPPNSNHLDPSSTDNNNNNNHPGERLWITGFSLGKQRGEMHYMDLDTHAMGQINSRTADTIRWPNEVHIVPTDMDITKDSTQQQQQLEDALLVSDGFLVPGKDNGGLYVVRNPGNPHSEYHVCLAGGSGVDGLLNRLVDTRQTKQQQPSSKTNPLPADSNNGWFYHRAIWIDLTGDGRYSILTARAKRPSSTNKAQLVWLERPKPYRYDETTQTPVDIDGTQFDPFSSRHTPWKLRVLDEGPDVMFSVADLDPQDDTIEVIASQFFNGQVTLHSIQKGSEPKVVFRRTIDDTCGPSFSSILADLDGNTTHQSKVIDSGSTVTTLKPGDSFSHLLVTNHKSSTVPSEQPSIDTHSDGFHSRDDSVTTTTTTTTKNNPNIDTLADGGSLFSYRVPVGSKDAWKTEPWVRSIIATGFRVRGQLGNMINPGAPGFCYTFYPTQQQQQQHEHDNTKWTRPLIGIAGDCAEAAYILRPVEHPVQDENKHNTNIDHSSNYVMMCEIDCGATVGSIGIGYDNISGAEQEGGYAKLYIPCYEKDKILIFAMGTGKDDDDDTDDW